MTERIAYTAEEAARLVKIGRTKIFEEIRAGRLRAKKAGRKTLITDEDLRAYVRGLPDREPALSVVV
jgi:excisionase family DNA binding protein